MSAFDVVPPHLKTTLGTHLADGTVVNANPWLAFAWPPEGRFRVSRSANLDWQPGRSLTNESATLEQVLITAELARRPAREPDYEAENSALATLAEQMTGHPAGVLQIVAELVMELCRSDSAGVSILEADGASEIFRWHAVAGAFAAHLGGSLPRDGSPCGVVLERKEVLLFASLIVASPSCGEPSREFTRRFSRLGVAKSS